MENNECSICLEKIENKDKTVLSCKHVFHSECIIKSIDYNNKCPYCRSFIEELIFKAEEEHSINKYLRILESDNILFTGYRFKSYKNRSLKIPLFIENDIIKEPIDLSIFLKFKNYISKENLNSIYSWALSMINFLNKKSGLVFYHNDNIFLLELFYMTLKKFPMDFENYKTMSLSVLYNYYFAKNILEDKPKLNVLTIRNILFDLSGEDENLNVFCNYQSKILFSFNE